MWQREPALGGPGRERALQLVFRGPAALGGWSWSGRMARVWGPGEGEIWEIKLLVFEEKFKKQTWPLHMGSSNIYEGAGAWSIRRETSTDSTVLQKTSAPPKNLCPCQNPQGNGGCYHPGLPRSLRYSQKRARKLTEFLLD